MAESQFVQHPDMLDLRAQLSAAQERIEELSHQRDVFEHERNYYASLMADAEAALSTANKEQIERCAVFVIKWCGEQESAFRSDELADAMLTLIPPPL